MLKTKPITLILFSLVIVVASRASDFTGNTQETAQEPKISVLRDTAEQKLMSESGATIIRYVVEAPYGIAPAETSDPSRQVGLILCFAEHEHPTGDEILPVREALNRLGLRNQYVLLAAHSQELKFGAADHEPIKKLIAWTRKTYPINPRRIYMYGKGEGGKISGEFAMMHPDLVTASITYSWGWWTMPSELKDPIDPIISAPEFYMVLGLRDLPNHLTTVRDAYERIRFKGYHVIYREIDDLGERTYHPPSNDDAIAWVTKLRNKNVPLAPGELKLLRRFSPGFPIPHINQEGFFSELSLVAGPSAGDVVQRLLQSSNENIRAAAAETCVHAIFSERAMSAVAQKVTDPSPKVRMAVFRALAINANWRSEAAQHALIDFATHPEKAIVMSDRISSVDAICQAVRFQVKGVRQDLPMFKALVGLLDDRDEEVSVMASNTLETVRDRDFRGDMPRAEREAPEGGWQGWLDEIATQAEGYHSAYKTCGWGGAHLSNALQTGRSHKDAVELFCMGGASLLGLDLATGDAVRLDPTRAFQYTFQAAQKGYLPAEAILGFMYATGKGVSQDYAQAAKCWVKAAEGGNLLAAQEASMLEEAPDVVDGPAIAEKWTKFLAEHSSNPTQ